MAYYTNMSLHQKQAVQNFYRPLDVNGDGKVTSQEYLYALKKAGCDQNSLPSNLFEVLDKNNDGTLDFEECVTFYYMIAGRRLVSISCASNVTLLVRRRRTTSDVHSLFLDNFALLRTELRAGNTSAGAGRSCYKRNKAAEAFKTGASVFDAANSAYDLGSTIASAAGY